MEGKDDDEESIWEITEDGQLILEGSDSSLEQEKRDQEDPSSAFKIESFEDYIGELLAANGGSLPDFGPERFPELFWSKNKTDGSQDIRSTNAIFHKVPNSMKFYVTLLNAKNRSFLPLQKKRKKQNQ